VQNVGQVKGATSATLVGMQDGRVLYKRSLTVTAPVGSSTGSSYNFASYVPRRTGLITWTVSFRDTGSVADQATATTRVVRRDSGDDEHDD
jgi:hypothetical protein